ncbi:MAG TPA: Dyp-type peroxidase [Solirubrobacteraceae bacterium]|nr:Dyp-type peroxidase [Solirubrobacteraceae bacterium]
MITATTPIASGVLPDAVVRSPNANAYFFAVTLDPALNAEGVQAWLKDVTALIAELKDYESNEPVMSVCTAFSASFFLAAGQPRFGLTPAQIPVGLASPPEVPPLAAIPQVAGDVMFYVMSLSEAAVAAFERGLSATRAAGLQKVTVELGFQRKDKRENFGFLDGLRNAQREREEVAFVDPELSPEEPGWVAGGSYLAYIKIAQNLEAMAAKNEEEQNTAIGRRKADGSRLDHPPGTPLADEGPFEGNACPVTAHVRKAGPRGVLHDETKIFRRGVPFLALREDGSIEAGLQFVSFQRSLSAFAVIFERWMTNTNFPAENAGEDSLLAEKLITLEKAGFFFVPPQDERFIGAPIFDTLPVDPCTIGHIVVQKQLVGRNGQPILSELGGISFEVRREGTAIGGQFGTDSTGRAVSPPLPRGVPLVVHEISPPTGFQQAEDVSVTLTTARELVLIVNHQSPEGPSPIYTG